jgi:hypothetical protein
LSQQQLSRSVFISAPACGEQIQPSRSALELRLLKLRAAAHEVSLRIEERFGALESCLLTMGDNPRDLGRKFQSSSRKLDLATAGNNQLPQDLKLALNGIAD